MVFFHSCGTSFKTSLNSSHNQSIIACRRPPFCCKFITPSCHVIINLTTCSTSSLLTSAVSSFVKMSSTLAIISLATMSCTINTRLKCLFHRVSISSSCLVVLYHGRCYNVRLTLSVLIFLSNLKMSSCWLCFRLSSKSSIIHMHTHTHPSIHPSIYCLHSNGKEWYGPRNQHA